jgi:hypothetical protein
MHHLNSHRKRLIFSVNIFFIFISRIIPSIKFKFNGLVRSSPHPLVCSSTLFSIVNFPLCSSHHPTSCIAAILTWVRQHNHYASSTLTPPLSGPPLTANIYMEDLLSNALFQQYKLVSLSKYLFLECCLPTPRSFS